MQRFAWLMIRFMIVMVPLVFLINGLTKGDWLQALLFAVAVAVGLTPEMLPMIVTINLAKGALAMSRKKVIVKRLNAIQNFGAMDVLCTDKTGTLTQDKVILEHHVDIKGDEDEQVLEFAWLNSHYQTGLRNLLDLAVLDRVDQDIRERLQTEYTLVDEVPFDFTRRRMSVIVQNSAGQHYLIAKGAVAETVAVCSSLRTAQGDQAIVADALAKVRDVARDMNDDGFRVIALGVREIEAKACLLARRRERSHPDGFHRVPRSAQGQRGRGDPGAQRQRRRGEDPDRRQRRRHPQRVSPGRFQGRQISGRAEDRGDER